MNKEEIRRVIEPRKRFWKWIVAVCGIGALAVGGGIYVFYPSQTQITYESVKAKRGEITSVISASGMLNPLNQVQIGSQISGNISEIFVDTNDLVHKGEVLAKIDDEKIVQQLHALKAQLQSAVAQLKSLQSTLKDKQWQYERLEKLYHQSKGKYPSFADVQAAMVAYEIAKAEIESKKGNIAEIEANIKSVEIDFSHTIITSPIDGVVLTRSVDVGQTVAASLSTPELFKIAQNLEEMKLVVQIAESDIGKIALNQEVSFRVDAYPHRKFSAKVDKINYGSTTSENIVSYEVSMNVDNKDLLLRPGMSATAEIIVAQKQGVVLIPVSALYFSPPSSEQSGDEVWILQGEEISSKPVKVGISDGKYVEVEGIAEGSEVVNAMREEK